MSKLNEAAYSKSVQRLMKDVVKFLKGRPESAKVTAHALMAVRLMVMADFFANSDMQHPDFMDLAVSAGGAQALKASHQMKSK